MVVCSCCSPYDTSECESLQNAKTAFACLIQTGASFDSTHSDMGARFVERRHAQTYYLISMEVIGPPRAWVKLAAAEVSSMKGNQPLLGGKHWQRMFAWLRSGKGCHRGRQRATGCGFRPRSRSTRGTIARGSCWRRPRRR